MTQPAFLSVCKSIIEKAACTSGLTNIITPSTIQLLIFCIDIIGKILKLIMKNKTSTIWIIAGSISIGLAVIGIFLPVLPTTPFLLLAAFCYSRGSSVLHQKLLNNPILGDYIRNYQEGNGIPLSQKIISISFLWLTIGGSIVFVKPALWLSLLLLSIASGVTIHLLRVKTRKTGEIPPVLDQMRQKSAGFDDVE